VDTKTTFLLSDKPYISTSFLLESIEAWEEDEGRRFNLEKLNASFRESVPVLDFLDWKIISVKRGVVETVLPLNPNSSNQYITHQAALMLLSADYTGGLALASLFHLAPIVGFWESINGYGIYMWGAESKIKWRYPSCTNLICKASIPQKYWDMLINRMIASKKIVFMVKVEMFNGSKLVAECDFTYWAQDIYNLRKNAFDSNKVALLYEHKTKTTAKLIAGLRALEQENPPEKRKFYDPYAVLLAGKHGLTLAKRFKKTIPQIQNMISARTKHLDRSVLEYVAGKEKVNIVNIGSGYDSRFWRLDIKNASIYDMDLPIMLIDRKRIFNYSAKKYIKCVPIDLINQNIDEILFDDNIGFDKTLPTFFIWEGGSMYFNDQEIDKVLSAISRMMSARCSIWFDYVSSDIINNKTGIKEIEDFIQNMGRMGESFINGFNNIKSLAKKYELNILAHESSVMLAESTEPHYGYYNFCILSK
jgi:methyltransferase (TIGR00027 family)